MSTTISQLKTNILADLDDAGVVFNDQAALNDSLQDGYDDISFICQQIIKQVDLNFTVDPYVNFKELVLDFLGVKALYNKNTKEWLEDNLTTKVLEATDSRYPSTKGTPRYWVPLSLNMVLFYPSYSTVPSLGYTLHYSAVAPTIGSDSDVVLIASEFVYLLEYYVLADLLEAAEELDTAAFYAREYQKGLMEYKDLVKMRGRLDLKV